jgi:L-threonylcarbamoyladenylate synthase
VRRRHRSTIVAFTGNEPSLRRPGGIGIDALAGVLGRAPTAPGADAPRASGTLASHYAPHATARLVAGGDLLSELAHSAASGERVAVLARTLSRPRDFVGAWIVASAAAQGYAHDLYANLRALDLPGVKAILIEAVPDDPDWFAVRDRLTRATN